MLTANNESDIAIDRAIGCFLGLAVGDALGTTLEFTARDSYAHLTDMVGGGPFKLAPGQWTDDTSMAICLAETLIARGRLDPLDLMSRFRGWRYQGHNSVTGHCFDIGNTTQAAIDRFISSGDPLSGDTSPKSAGNGSIMRLAPVAIFFRSDPEAAAALAAEQSQTTHGADECLESCALMARILTALLGGEDWQTAVRQEQTTASEPKVRALANGAWRQKTRKLIRSTGYVIDTLEASLWAVDQTHNFRDALLLAVNLGDDADTVGAVTGQFAGAKYGLSGIPDGWLSKLAWRQKLQDMALALANRKQ